MTAASTSGDRAVAAAGTTPLYWRLLRLRNIHPNGWQRALLVEGVLTVAVVLTLADVATAWTLLVLPAVSAAIVKGHDVLAGMLPRRPGGPAG
jgi:hypothetical protein